MLILEDVVPKLMRVIGEIKDFLPRFSDATAFHLETPSICIDPQTRKVVAPKYLLLPYIFNTRLFRELCGAISNVSQCLSNLQSDLLENTNCVPVLQLLAYDLGDGLRDLYNMLKDVDVDVGTKNMSLLDHVDTDMTMLIDAMSHIVKVCNRKMHARVVEVMYTLLHSWGPQMPKRECKRQDVLKATHDYRIVSHILTKSEESSQTQTVYLDSRNERAFTFSLWAKTDKDVKVDLKILWDCFSTSMSQAELAQAVKNGEDKLPIESSFKLMRRQGEMAFHARYLEERSTDDYKHRRRRTWDWRDKNDQTIKNILNHKGWAYFAFTVSISEQRIRGELKKSQDPTVKLQMKFNDTKATADLRILSCIRQTKPLQTIRLEMTRADEQYEVLNERADDEYSPSNMQTMHTSMGATAVIGATTGLTASDGATTMLTMKSSALGSQEGSQTQDVGKSFMKSENKSSFFSEASGAASGNSGGGNEKDNSKKGKGTNPFDDPSHPFEKAGHIGLNKTTDSAIPPHVVSACSRSLGLWASFGSSETEKKGKHNTNTKQHVTCCHEESTWAAGTAGELYGGAAAFRRARGGGARPAADRSLGLLPGAEGASHELHHHARGAGQGRTEVFWKLKGWVCL